MYRAVARRVPHGLDGRRHGDVVRQAVEAVETAQDRLLRIRLPWWSALTVAVVVTVVALWLDPLAGLVVAAQAALTLGVLRWQGPRWSDGRAVMPELSAEVTEAVRSAQEFAA
ncbi:MAG: hypothetical protein QM621_07065 [Aeromicrobium sp.]|uniref:hypothetical protein n=1 Tax=Aeromicrobium sp. TaxID=1871063 RepID=UPI0039E412C0